MGANLCLMGARLSQHGGGDGVCQGEARVEAEGLTQEVLGADLEAEQSLDRLLVCVCRVRGSGQFEAKAVLLKAATRR